MDGKLARGYSREFIQKQAHIPDGLPIHTKEFQAAIPSSISKKTSGKLHDLVANELLRVEKVNERLAVYAVPYFMPVGEYIEPTLIVSLLSMKTSLNAVGGYEDIMFARLNLHALARLSERLDQKPNHDLINVQSIARWVALYQFVYGGVETSLPLMIPHKNGFFLGKLDYWGDTDHKMLRKYKMTRSSFGEKYVDSGKSSIEKKPCTIQTFVSADLLRLDQKNFHTDLMSFKDRSEDVFKFSLLSGLNEIWITERVEDQISEFIEILDRNSALMEDSIHYLEKEFSDEENEVHTQNIDQTVAKYLRKLDKNHRS